jgi:IMP dehydrogenase
MTDQSIARGHQDGFFYLTAEEFFAANRHTALTYDDVSLATLYSAILPKDADLSTSLSESLRLQAPIVSSDMDTVTEARMAIAMALNGGMGILHYNMPLKQQVSEVGRVKHHIHGLMQDPITVEPELLVGDVLDLIEEKHYDFRTFPVTEPDGKLVGLLTGKVIKERYRSKKVAEAMTPLAELFTLPERQVAADPIREADKFFTENIGIHKLLIVDEKGLLKGLITLSDIEKITSEVTAARRAARDSDFRLVCAAAISILRRSNGELDRNRILAHVAELVAENVDAVAVSTAHGHSAGVGEMVKLIRGEFRDLTIIAGNVTSGAGVEYLAECGASAIKIGQGPGSICTTRIVAGVGIPQLTALHVASLGAKAKGVRLIADGGITKSGDIVKALTIADAVICGGLLAGCREAPGELIEISGKLYKQYRGMGSLSAMKQGSAARYGHDKEDKSRKLTAEGIEALKEVSGSVDTVLADLIGGIRSGMGYLGAATLPELRSKARYVRVSPAGQREAAPHDVIEVATRKEN